MGPEEVGESTYETALEWDNIHPARHDQYFDFSQFIPLLDAQHKQRSESDPEIQYIIDQYKLAQEFKDPAQLSLNKNQRIKDKESGEARLLEIENKRRKAKGEEVLKTFADL